MIKDMTIQTFLDELASKASTPGGGGGAAVNGAIGAALISMVANFTIGKKGYEDAHDEFTNILKQSEELRSKLTDAIKDDVDVFNRVMAAYGMAKETEEEKKSAYREYSNRIKRSHGCSISLC